LTGGGSGGHITPLLSLAHALKKASPNSRLVYIAWKGDKLENLGERIKVFDHVFYISAGKLRRYHKESWLRQLIDIKTLFLNSRDFFRVIAGTAAARRLLKKIKPDVVFLKGGFVGVPVAIAARKLSVPIVTHDSDAIGGMANKIAGRWAAVHTTGMPPSYYNYPKGTVEQVGIPIDERIKEVTPSAQAKYKEALGLPEDSLVLLVAGGGLGSQRLNKLILSIAPALLENYPTLHLIHFSGPNNLKDINRRYADFSQEQTKRITVVGFSDEFYKYSGAADLIITRAGATTLAEFAAQAKACIVVPSPFLTGGHQLKNAEELKKAKAIKVVFEDDRPEKLQELVKELLDNHHKRTELAKRLNATFMPDASKRLSKILLGISADHK
jgi:UDP-N-acetylglucosamine--N-acetylmuramyl-(pentapeptide) pyrophosphoryl-undecaprenol N-acetylglucosamine transferase